MAFALTSSLPTLAAALESPVVAVQSWAAWLGRSTEPRSVPGVEIVQRELADLLSHDPATQPFAVRIQAAAPTELGRQLRLLEADGAVVARLEAEFEPDLAAFLRHQVEPDVRSLGLAVRYFAGLLAQYVRELEGLIALADVSLAHLERVIERLEEIRKDVQEIERIREEVLWPQLAAELDSIPETVVALYESMRRDLRFLEAPLDRTIFALWQEGDLL